jgi:hypothetical protein
MQQHEQQGAELPSNQWLCIMAVLNGNTTYEALSMSLKVA